MKKIRVGAELICKGVFRVSAESGYTQPEMAKVQLRTELPHSGFPKLQAFGKRTAQDLNLEIVATPTL